MHPKGKKFPAKSKLSLVTENQSSHLNALPALGIRSRPGINKSRVRRPSPSLGARLEGIAVEALNQQPLVGRHAAEVVKLLVRVVVDGGGLAVVAVGVAVRDGRDVLFVESSRSSEGQGRGLDGALVEASPDIDDAVAALEQLVGLVGEVAAHALLGRGGGLVNVDAQDGRAAGVGIRAADGVVKDVDFVGAGDLVQQQALDLWVVLVLDGVVVDKLRFCGGGMPWTSSKASRLTLKSDSRPRTSWMTTSWKSSP
ncbi:uncharacterized protein TrAtP1_005784 [Trichoderma atroviride]|uniref:uncharacterized protein n=1 Tax=Hypocrea atroviridis TaxID=63577 RepID=UPI0033329E51|nr:hypothetical protein TrAtP1_005784 [Trichoderma atroviride]